MMKVLLWIRYDHLLTESFTAKKMSFGNACVTIFLGDVMFQVRWGCETENNEK